MFPFSQQGGKRPRNKATQTPGEAAHNCNSSTREAEVRGFRVQRQPGIHSEFKTTLGYSGRVLSQTRPSKAEPNRLQTDVWVSGSGDRSADKPRLSRLRRAFLRLTDSVPKWGWLDD